MKKRAGAAAIVCLSLAGCNNQSGADAQLAELISQLNNESCNYSSNPFKVCVKGERHFFSRVLKRAPDKYDCPLAAAQCLERLGEGARPAVSALVKVLKDGPNDYDTGDGIVPVRSAVAKALAAAKDPAVIPALGEALKNAAPYERDAGALVSSEPAAREALIESLSSFGTAAHGEWPQVADVLKERIEDERWLENRWESFVQSRALSLASQRAAQKNPGASSFVIQAEEIEQAKIDIKSGASAYRKEFEFHSLDRVGSSAAAALGRLGAAEAKEDLLRALKRPALAAASASALAELKVKDREVEAALSHVLQSQDYGPEAKGAAAIAGAELGFDSSLPLIQALLKDSFTAAASCRALAKMDERGKPALSALIEVLNRPSLAVKNERGIIYSPEASELAKVKIEAAKAVAHIAAKDEAIRVLEPMLSDEDVRGVAKKLLADLKRRPS